MLTSAAFALRHFAAFARCKGMCWLFVNVPRMFQGDIVRGDERNKTHLAIGVSMFTKKELKWER